MARLEPVQAGLLRREGDDLAAAVRPDSVLFVALNVGDADAAICLLAESNGTRPVVVIDAGVGPKVLTMLDQLAERGLCAHRSIDLLVATHPHQDHIGGMPLLLRSTAVRELWDPSYRLPNPAYFNMQLELEASDTSVLHPTAGTRRFLGDALVTVLSPAARAVSRFDTFGVDPNNASISLLIQFPMRRTRAHDDDPTFGRVYRPLVGDALRRILLGGDAQTGAWGQVMDDFPAIDGRSVVRDHLEPFVDPEPLRADVFKVPHHASKRGLSLELIERVRPGLSVISCTDNGPKYGFPHQVALDQLREALDPSAKSNRKRRRRDWSLGIMSTGDVTTPAPAIPLGTVVVEVPVHGRTVVWRLGDRRDEVADLANARRLHRPDRGR